MDKKTLLFLLKGGHINMEKRIADGLWPHKPIALKECIKVIEENFNENRFFPYPWIERFDGELIDDVIVIEKVNNNEFICHSRSASPSNLKLISEQEKKVFRNFQKAIEFYLKWGLNLPGDLDGWKVEK